MRRWVRAGLVLFFLILAVAVVFLPRLSVLSDVPKLPNAPALQDAAGPAPEITIRNVIEKPVVYRVAPHDGLAPKTPRTILPGAVDRYPAPGLMVISFDREGETVTRSLSPGRPYSFRYDSNDLLEIWLGSHGREDAEDLAPFVPSPDAVVEKMLDMAGVGEDDVVYDIGCGDGRIVIAAAAKRGARGVGIEIDPERIRECLQNANAAGVDDRVRFLRADAMKTDISEATVVTLYLLPESNALLRPKFEKELKRGTPVVSHNYSIPGWELRETATARVKDASGREHAIFLYRK
jgi:hypothetical protein